MSPPVGDLQRIVALLTAIEGDNGPAVTDLLREFTLDDVLRMGTMYVETIRLWAGEQGLPMALALQILGRCAAEQVDAQGGSS